MPLTPAALRTRSNLVHEVVQRWHHFLQILAHTDLLNQSGDLRVRVEWILVDRLPVVENALGEGLPGGQRAQMSCESYDQPSHLPNDSATGRWALQSMRGVPGICSSPITTPLREFKHW